MLLLPLVASYAHASESESTSLHARLLELARHQMRRVGTAYGGWTLMPSLLGNGSIVYSFGLGNDISWDLALIGLTGASVHGFDNTPGSNRYFKQKGAALAATPEFQRFRRHPYLLCAANGTLELALPKGHGLSYATVSDGGARGFKSKTTWRAPCRTIDSLMRMLNHTRLDVLKLDVESSEFAYFDALAADNSPTPPVLRLPACQLLIEFHSRLHKAGYEAKVQTLLSLATLGFTLVHNVRSLKFAADDAFFINPRFCDPPPSLAGTASTRGVRRT